MAYQTPVIERFGGLDTNADTAETGVRAQSMSNVDIRGDGTKLGVRDGLTEIITGGQTYTRMCRSTSLAGAAEGIGIFANTGAALQFTEITHDAIQSASTWGGANTRWSSDCFLGTPTTKILFIASLNSGTAVPDTLRKFDSTGFVATSVGEPRQVAVTPWDNRLAQAGFIAAADSPTGANGSESTVFFSDAGAPETFSANNFIHLRPGDQERICAMVPWRDLLFVFKRTALFVFYGVETASTGDPVFRYRGPIPLPATCLDPSNLDAFAASLSSVACAGDDGVYVLLADGVYRTNGGDFQEVSRAVRPSFQPTAAGLYTYTSLSFALRRLYVGSSTGLLVYDTSLGEWLSWSLAAGAATPSNVMVGMADSTASRDPWDDLLVTQSSKVYRFNAAATADDATAIASHYQTGFIDHGFPGVKTLRETLLWGIGTPSLAIGTDYGTVDTAAAVTLGISPAIAVNRDRTARRGSNFSYKLSAASGFWQVNRIEPHIHARRAAGTTR